MHTLLLPSWENSHNPKSAPDVIFLELIKANNIIESHPFKYAMFTDATFLHIILVSLRNKTVGRRGRQIACA